jgi:mycoredoxin
MAEPVTVYSTPWCGYCHRLAGQLKREGIEFRIVDIEQFPDAANFVEKVNEGDQTVPTVVFPDGTTLTNPSLAEVKQRLAS